MDEMEVRPASPQEDEFALLEAVFKGTSGLLAKPSTHLLTGSCPRGVDWKTAPPAVLEFEGAFIERSCRDCIGSAHSCG